VTSVFHVWLGSDSIPDSRRIVSKVAATILQKQVEFEAHGIGQRDIKIKRYLDES